MENKEFLSDILTRLKKLIPHQWRVQSYSKNKPQATVMAYIDARDCMDVLDAYAVYGWHREHYEVDGKVYCKVGIVMPDGSIQWRSDCGVESNQDAEKGQSSDAFKRACVNFGIGRFLYDMEIKYITASAKKEAGNWPYCIDEQGKQIWDLTTYINNKNPNSPKAPETKTASEPSQPELLAGTTEYAKCVRLLAEGKATVASIKARATLTPELEKQLVREANTAKQELEKTKGGI